MTVEVRPTRVGDVAQAPPQGAGRGAVLVKADLRSRRFCSMPQHGGEWVRVTVGDQVKVDLTESAFHPNPVGTESDGG